MEYLEVLQKGKRRIELADLDGKTDRQLAFCILLEIFSNIETNIIHMLIIFAILKMCLKNSLDVGWTLFSLATSLAKFREVCLEFWFEILLQVNYNRKFNLLLLRTKMHREVWKILHNLHYCFSNVTTYFIAFTRFTFLMCKMFRDVEKNLSTNIFLCIYLQFLNNNWNNFLWLINIAWLYFPLN